MDHSFSNLCLKSIAIFIVSVILNYTLYLATKLVVLFGIIQSVVTIYLIYKIMNLSLNDNGKTKS